MVFPLFIISALDRNVVGRNGLKNGKIYNMQKEYKYVVVYSHTKGRGNIEIFTNYPIDSFENFKQIQKYVRDSVRDVAEDAIITNIIKISETRKYGSKLSVVEFMFIGYVVAIVSMIAIVFYFDKSL